MPDELGWNLDSTFDSYEGTHGLLLSGFVWSASKHGFDFWNEACRCDRIIAETAELQANRKDSFHV